MKSKDLQLLHEIMIRIKRPNSLSHAYNCLYLEVAKAINYEMLKEKPDKELAISFRHLLINLKNRTYNEEILKFYETNDHGI